MDAIERLERDHRIAEQVLADYDLARSDSQRRGVVELLIRELSKHAALEELTIYPLARRRVPDGDALVDAQLAEHMTLKRLLADLDGRRAGDPEEGRLVGELGSALAEHTDEEEHRFFPALRPHVDAEALDELGEALDAAKRVAPTRPHPRIPDRPPAEAVLAAVGALYDRVRDRLEGRPMT